MITTQSIRKIIIPVLTTGFIMIHSVLGLSGSAPLMALLPMVLMAACLLLTLWLWFGHGDALSGLGFILIMTGHGLLGHHLANDALSSGTMLVGNILVFYVGINLYQHCSKLHFTTFILSYLALFYIFIMTLNHAESLFLLAVLGFVATARDFKLLSYFWALVLSFTIAQPYAWEALLLSYFFLTMMFSIKATLPSRTAVLFLGVGLILLFLVLFPIAVMMLGENPYNLFNVFKNPDIIQSLVRTIYTATIATVLLALMGIPLAYAISRLEFKGKAILLSLIDIPIVIPQSVAGIALLTVFGKQQIIGNFLYHYLGIRFDGAILGIIIAQMFVAMPFILKTAIAAFDAVPLKYELAARNLGANSMHTFRRIAFPLAGRGIFLGAVIAWARAAGEFGAVFFIAASPETAPISVYTRFMSMGLSETAPLVSILLLFSVIMFFLLQLIGRMIPSINQQGGRF